MKKRFSPGTRRLAFCALAAGAVYCAMLFGTLARLEDMSGMRPFDLRPAGYGTEQAHALLAALEAAGRRYYLERQLVLDLFYPTLLALTLAGLYRYLGQGLRRGGFVRAGIGLCWLAAGLDYAENAGIAAMLVLWPDLPGWLVGLASGTTIAKSAATSLALAGLAVVFALWARTKVLPDGGFRRAG